MGQIGKPWDGLEFQVLRQLHIDQTPGATLWTPSSGIFILDSRQHLGIWMHLTCPILAGDASSLPSGVCPEFFFQFPTRCFNHFHWHTYIESFWCIEGSSLDRSWFLVGGFNPCAQDWSNEVYTTMIWYIIYEIIYIIQSSQMGMDRQNIFKTTRQIGSWVRVKHGHPLKLDAFWDFLHLLTLKVTSASVHLRVAESETSCSDIFCQNRTVQCENLNKP